MNEATPTKRPLKKGDPCWIRIRRDGNPVLAEYRRFMGCGQHSVFINDGEGVYIVDKPGSITYTIHWEAIFVAKPIPPNWREIMEAQ